MSTDKDNCPSVSVAVVEHGEVILAETYGLADITAARPATPETAYALASITKPMTATAICVAADEGLLDLDAPIPFPTPASAPGDQRWPAPTGRQLLQHRRGFGAHYDFHYAAPGNGERIDATPYAFLHRPPGTAFEYANLGYRTLGHPLEATTGQALADFVRGRVFDTRPDWDTLTVDAVDAEDLETSRAFTRYTAEKVVRRATVGRRLARLAVEAGFGIETTIATTPVFTDFEHGDHTLGLGRNMQQAIAEGHIDRTRGEAWFAGLAREPFYASFTLVMVVCFRL